MSIGNSGRIVIEVDPEAKRRLYAALARDGLTLKDWFLRSAEGYLAESGQLSLSFPQRNTVEGPGREKGKGNQISGGKRV
jgi:hypothetical protein